MTTIELHWYSAPPTGDSQLLLDTLDLFGGDDGLRPAYNGLLRAVGDRQATTLKETITLRADGNDFDELAGVLQALDLWQKRVAWSLNETDAHEVWLLMQWGDETGGLEAQVLDLQYSTGDDLLNYGVPHVNQLTLVITRTPWEEEKDSEIGELTYSVDALGGLDDPTVSAGPGSFTGDLPARIAMMDISSSSGITEIWLALQSDRLRDPAAFVPVWPLSAATYLSQDTTVETDADAYNGSSLTCDFSSTEEEATRVTLLLEDVRNEQALEFDADAFYAQTGHYAVLLRAKAGSNTEIHLRMGYGWSISSGGMIPIDVGETIWRDLTALTSTAYLLLDMQSLAIPPAKIQAAASQFKVSIAAARVSGSGSLYLDCLGVLPLDEGMLHLTCDELGSGKLVRVSVAPDGQRLGTYFSGNAPVNLTGIDAEIWEMPMNGTAPNLVAFAQRKDSYLTDTLSVTMQYCRRFRLLRGAA